MKGAVRRKEKEDSFQSTQYSPRDGRVHRKRAEIHHQIVGGVGGGVTG